MKNVPSALLFFLVVAAVAAGAARLSVVLSSKWEKSARQTPHGWIHTKLGLTPRQEMALAGIEQRYQEQRRKLEMELARANRDLADAILADGRETENVNGAIERIHAVMGQLQKVTVGHVFEMKAVLSPEQYDRLLRFTASALNGGAIFIL